MDKKKFAILALLVAVLVAMLTWAGMKMDGVRDRLGLE